jgi:NAD(P)H dehydrogenase (quinone)
MNNSTIKLAVVYYSSTGTIHALAHAAAAQGEREGAEVRLRRVRETAPRSAVESRPAWAATAERTRNVPDAEIGDIPWADTVLIGAPTRFGLPASQLTAFIDTTGPLWQQGLLADKVYSAFTSSGTAHGGQESTLLTLNHVFQHWGGILVSPGYTDPIMYVSGRPYGAGHVTGAGGDPTPPSEIELDTIRHQTRRMLHVATALRDGGWRPDTD